MEDQTANESLLEVAHCNFLNVHGHSLLAFHWLPSFFLRLVEAEFQGN